MLMTLMIWHDCAFGRSIGWQINDTGIVGQKSLHLNEHSEGALRVLRLAWVSARILDRSFRISNERIQSAVFRP